MKPIVFITGADKGLGFALAGRFLKGGYAVVAGMFDSDKNLKPLSAQYPNDLTILYLDVTEDYFAHEAAKSIQTRNAGLDILINNSGIHLESEQNLLEEINDMQLIKTMDVNAFGPVRVVRHCIPLLEKGKKKLIINISSDAGSISDCTRGDWFGYCMSKAALNMASKIIQNLLAPKGIKVLAVHPGWMRTDMGGPQATYHPDESAEHIYQLAMRDWKMDDPIYMDYLGNVKNW